MPVDQTADGRAKRLLLVTSDPDQVPVRRLNTSAKSRAEPGTSADTNAALVQGRSVRDTGELELTGPNVGGRVID